MEHRWGKRSPVDVTVALYVGSGHVFGGRMTNASLSGALVHTEARLPAFSRLIVELHSGESGPPARSRAVFAYVAREASEGLGLEWTEFSPPLIAALLSGAAATLPHHEEQHLYLERGSATPFLRGDLFEQRSWR
jgi:hypothetical protein